MVCNYIFSFVAGGLVTCAITYFEVNGNPLLSRLAALFPVFTWLSYFFIQKYVTPQAITSHMLFVLLGTLFCWVPYMLTLYFLTPKIGGIWALAVGISLFICLAIVFVKCYYV